MTDNGDNCPRCHKAQMPKVTSGKVTARACQGCGFIEEFDSKGRPVFNPALPAVTTVENR